MTQIKVFGREPTLWIAVIAAILNWLVGFSWDGLTAIHAVWINAAINAIAAATAASMTRPIAPQAFTYAITTIFGMLTAYGLDFTQEQVATTQMLVLTILALITRNQVSPTENFKRTGVIGN